jgi:hypothetical protein
VVIEFDAASIANSDNYNCDFFEVGYTLLQKGFSEGDYDTTLIKVNGNPLTLSGSKLELAFRSHELVGEAMPLKTYDSSGTECNLEDVNTKSCTQVFELFASSYDGEIGQFAEITVTFKTECF